MIPEISPQELQQFRADTRGTAHRVHFNNAGTSLPPAAVVETITGYLNEEALYGGYETEAKYREQFEQVYALIAQLINAGTDEVAIVENASTGWWIAFNGMDFKQGDVIITSEMEYVTNLVGLLHVEKTHGVSVTVIPNDERGNFYLPALEAAITPRVKLIAITHVPSTAGTIMPVAGIGKIARRHGILYLVDACQSAGQLPVDVKAIGCDMLAVTGRKYLRGPRGTGFLYVRKEVQDKLKLFFMDGFTAPVVSREGFETRKDARRFELYEKNRALTLGLGVAIRYALGIGIDRVAQRVQLLAGLLRQRLARIDGITVHDRGDHQCGIVTFSVRGMDGRRVKSLLAEKQINISVGNAVSTLLYMDKHGLDGIVRASVHYYNTEEELQLLCDALVAMIK